MGGIVGRETDRDAISGNHANAKASHPAGQLCSYFLPGLEGDLIAAAAQYLVDTAGGLDEVVSRQMGAPVAR